MPSATIQVGFASSILSLTVTSSDPQGSVQITGSTINLKPSMTGESFDLTFVPDTSHDVTAITGIEPGPPQNTPSGQGLPTVSPSMAAVLGEFDLQCDYPEGSFSQEVTFSSTLFFMTNNGAEHHDPSIAFNPPE